MLNKTRTSALQCTRKLALASLLLSAVVVSQGATAAIALDRTRVILNGSEKSASLGITNQNKALPYLAQTWIEDSKGHKINSPLLAIPPVQRVEPGAKGQVKVQVTSEMSSLPQDRESTFFFNIREIPPKSDKPNTLQIALQTRIKLFYRPAGIEMDQNSNPWQAITLTREGDRYVVHNPTPYYVTLSSISSSVSSATTKGFEPIMIAPKDKATLKGSAAAVGNSPVLTYINDYGGRPKLIFGCGGNTCTVKDTKVG
ncbi:Periplasmic fimbrial chaperone StfD [Lelliottia jeotgali]|nr:Periplasmic fimbrial chaperone StfD [Lelliottia jeotgali]